MISFALTNRSPALTVRLDPSSLTIRQGETFLSGRLNTRDSSGQPGLLPPSSAQIGTLSVRTTQPGPITVQWAAVDVVTGQRYPISFTYTPK
ncbi:hypothetical protein [Deinococcus multiflagellatus]|uniref:CopC domain-containing protein n=1 Tax=Deinococcus multiflagellatus TaxID=1656887 RepID=A0ABW1ZU18_9DEIO